MQRAIFMILALGTALSSSGPAAAFEPIVPTVSNITYDEHGDRATLRIVTDAPTAFTFFSLENPRRLILDFPDLVWDLDTPDLAGNRMVTGLRYGMYRQGRGRLVLDLAEPLRVNTAETISDGENSEVRIALAPISATAFAATAGEPEGALWESQKFEAPKVESAPGDVIIAIDPGHGGVDHGAEKAPLTEKALVLRFARVLNRRINAEPGLASFLTRDRDRFILLGDRVRIAREGGAQVLISLHADLLEDGGASGMTVYTLSDKGSDDAEETLAIREDRDGVLGGADLGGDGDDLTRVLIDLAQRGTMSESDKLSAKLLSHLDGEFELLKTRPHRKAGFRVLKAPDIPSVLIELGFLSSKRDRRRLTSLAWQRRVADALTAGISAWAQVASPGFLEAKQ